MGYPCGLGRFCGANEQPQFKLLKFLHASSITHSITMSSEKSAAPSLGKVLVVGGCGFLGSHIVNLLTHRHPQTQISVLDLRTSSNRSSHPNISYHDGDITDFNSIKALFEKLKLDAVIHTASPHFNLPNEIQEKVNVGGTKNLLKAAQETAVKAFVYTSSASVILDHKTQLVNADETWPLVYGDAQPEYYTTTKVCTINSLC